MAEGRRRGRPPRTNGQQPQTEEVARRMVTVDIKLSMEYKNWPDFQHAWENQYSDYLRQFAVIESAILTIPPTGEPDVIELPT